MPSYLESIKTLKADPDRKRISVMIIMVKLTALQVELNLQLIYNSQESYY